MADIITIAHSYVNQKEIPPNKGFIDKNFEKEMKSIGWKPFWSWCCMFMKLIHTIAYFGTEKQKYLSAFNPSCQKTWKNFNKMFPECIRTEPEVGAMIIWKTGAFTGHIGIIASDSITIEGNRKNMVKYGSRDLKKSVKGFEILGYVKI